MNSYRNAYPAPSTKQLMKHGQSVKAGYFGVPTLGTPNRRIMNPFAGKSSAFFIQNQTVPGDRGRMWVQ